MPAVRWHGNEGAAAAADAFRGAPSRHARPAGRDRAAGFGGCRIPLASEAVRLADPTGGRLVPVR